MTFQLQTPVARSPLHHRKPTAAYNGDLSIREHAHTTMITLRGDVSELQSALSGNVTVELPTQINTVNAEGPVSALKLSPDEWLVLESSDASATIDANKLNDSLGSTHGQIVDVSDYYTRIEIAGPQAGDVLAKLTNFDLRERAFQPGMATRTRVAHATIALLRGADLDHVGPSYQIIVRASMADYLWSLLTHAAQEFGIAPQAPRMGEAMRY